MHAEVPRGIPRFGRDARRSNRPSRHYYSIVLYVVFLNWMRRKREILTFLFGLWRRLLIVRCRNAISAPYPSIRIE